MPPDAGAGPTGGIGNTAAQVSTFSMNAVLKGAAAMLIVAASIYVISKALKGFEEVSVGTLGLVGLALAELTAVLFALSKIPTNNLLKGAGAVGILSGSIYLLGTALQTFKGIGINELGALAGALVLVGGGLALIGSLMTGPQLIGVLGFTAAIGLLSLSIMGIAKAFEIASRGFKSFGDSISKVISTPFESLSKLLEVISNINPVNVAAMGPALISLAAGVTVLAAASAAKGVIDLVGSLFGNRNTSGTLSQTPTQQSPVSPSLNRTTNEMQADSRTVSTNTNRPTVINLPDNAKLQQQLAELIAVNVGTNQKLNALANQTIIVNMDGQKVGNIIKRSAMTASTGASTARSNG